MKVNSNRDISFKSIYTNKAFKRSLEFASDNGALFSAATILALSTVIRPAAIWFTPKTDKENKKIACAKSISSSAVGYGLTYAISKPFSDSIKKIDNNPKEFLSPKTIKFFKNKFNDITQSKSYNFATQMFKLGLGIIIAAPKAVLTSAVLPFIMQNIFQQKKQDKNSQNIAFKGRNDNKLAKNIGKLLDKKRFQIFSEKYKDSNFPIHIVATTDTVTTATFIHQVKKSKKIEEERKKTLICNAGISTGLSIICSYILDAITQKPTEKFIQNFRKANAGLPNVEKQVNGIKIAKPIVLLGIVYYMLIPLLSTFLAERVTQKNKCDDKHAVSQSVSNNKK